MRAAVKVAACQALAVAAHEGAVRKAVGGRLRSVATDAGAPFTPLLEVKGRIGDTEPVGVRRAGIRAALASGNHPVNTTAQIDRPQQRFAAHEPLGGRGGKENREALVGAALVFDGDAKPDVSERPCRFGY